MTPRGPTKFVLLLVSFCVASLAGTGAAQEVAVALGTTVTTANPIVGGPVTFRHTITVAAGSRPGATNLVLTQLLPTGATYHGSSDGRCALRCMDRIECALAEAYGATVVDVSMTFSTAGTYTSRAGVEVAEYELDASNNMTAASVTVAPGLFSIRGVVLVDGAGRAGVAVSATNQSTGSVHATTTLATGAYEIPGLQNGGYTVAASLNGYDFLPEFSQRTIAGADVTGVDFSGTPRTFSISGTITESGIPREGVRVSAGSRSALSGADGTYRITGLPNGTYTVTPYLRGDRTFQPPTATRTINGGSISGVDFALLPISYSVVGVIQSRGEGVEGITVRVGLTARTAVTDRAGAYEITGLAPGLHTIRPESAEYEFDPIERSVQVGPGPTASADFEATPRR